MDYEKKYKEAFALMKDCIPDENGLVHVRPDDIFPELKESEDERIRKEIIRFIFNYPQKLTNRDSWLVWLEKQKGTEREIEGNSLCKGEQKPVVPRFRVGDTIRNKKTNRLFYVHHLSEAGFLSLSDTNKTVYQGYLSENDFENYELVEQKPAEWSEEDEQYLLVCKNALAKYQVSDKWDAGIISRWLENKLKSLRPQKQCCNDVPSREYILNVWELGNYWKELTKGVCSTEHGTQLEYIQNHWKEGEYYDKISVCPQNKWKPSEEQLIDLEIVISDFIPISFREKRVSMENLLEQLKKLREE